ncbi:stalk domain-containing protein [Gudongella sp. DL1XJH-153]|uniref:stalk domain-containing protein n=1 Tax=Gudongella sp. DL1XJH-153 TaxID=3409804 RepID=UPI003BB4F919
MKKLLVLLLVVVLIFGSGVFAEDISVEIDGRKLDFDVSPTIIDGRTVLPARTIFESLGLEVEWDDSTRTVTGVGEGKIISLVIDHRIAYVNGEPTNLDVPPTIIDDRSMVPVRFVAESTGADVAWDSATRTVLIENGGNQKEDSFRDHTYIVVEGGDLSGHRLPNVVVDIGYGEREYWAYTNENGQLVRVVADEIRLQDESIEDVLDSGRYYYDEAKVPGTEHPELDEGHIIADSLGGVSNAYNITPQNSTLNRHGDQAYMEKTIRDAGGANNFEAIITYPNSTTHIPSHYKYTYTVAGHEIVDEFDNINPDDYSPSTGISDITIPQIIGGDLNLSLLIDRLDLENRIVVIRNKGMDLLQTFMSNTRGMFR